MDRRALLYWHIGAQTTACWGNNSALDSIEFMECAIMSEHDDGEEARRVTCAYEGLIDAQDSGV